MRNNVAPLVLCAAAALASILISPRAWSATPSFQGLGHLPGGDLSIAYALSDNGSVVIGASDSETGGNYIRWTSDGGMQVLPGLPRVGISDVSGDGSTIVGNSVGPDSAKAFRWTSGGGFELIGDFPGAPFRSEAWGISADGSTIVGYKVSKSFEAFRWTETGGMQGLGYLSGGQLYSAANDVSRDGAIIVGTSGEAFRWTNEDGMQGLGYLSQSHSISDAVGISADGSTIVGHSGIVNDSTEAYEAFLWTRAGGMQGLGFLPGGDSASSNALHVSGDGSIVLGLSSSNAPLGREPFIWDSANGMRSLQQVLVNDYGLDLTGWTLSVPRGISADGRTIVGDGINPLGQGEAWIATIPEPSSLALVGLGGIFLFLTIVRARAAARPN
jgi:uncharacterized membrane protein